MSMVKFSPIALNFGYGFVLSVHFFWTLCITLKNYLGFAGRYHIESSVIRLILNNKTSTFLLKLESFAEEVIDRITQ